MKWFHARIFSQVLRLDWEVNLGLLRLEEHDPWVWKHQGPLLAGQAAASSPPLICS